MCLVLLKLRIGGTSDHMSHHLLEATALFLRYLKNHTRHNLVAVAMIELPVDVLVAVVSSKDREKELVVWMMSNSC